MAGVLFKDVEKAEGYSFAEIGVRKGFIFCRLVKAKEVIIKLVTEHKKLTIAEIVVLTGINRNTAKKHLKKLVREGYLKMWGVVDVSNA